MQFLTKIDRALAKVEEVLLALLLVGLVVLAATQVLLRNIWSTSIDWADLTLQNATVLIGLLGAAVATSEGRHLNIDVFGRRLKGRSSFVLRVVIGVFAVVICALLTRGGWETFTANYAPWKANLPAGWGVAKMLKQELAEGSFPQWLSQVLLPVGFALIGTHFVLRLFRDIGSLITGKGWEGGDEKQLEGDEYLDQMLSHAEDEAKGGEKAPDEVDSADLDTLDELAAKYEDGKRWSDLIHTLKRKVELVETDAHKVQLWLRIASLSVERFANQAEAMKAYERALALDPDDKHALGALHELYEARGESEKLAALEQLQDGDESRESLLKTIVDDRNAALAELDDDEPEEAVTEFEPRLRREMGRVVREKQEAEAAEGFDLAAGPVIVSKEAEEPEADKREEKVEKEDEVEKKADGADTADAADGEEVKR